MRTLKNHHSRCDSKFQGFSSKLCKGIDKIVRLLRKSFEIRGNINLGDYIRLREISVGGGKEELFVPRATTQMRNVVMA